MAIPYPTIDPIAVKLGPLAIRWYGLSYLAGIALALWYAIRLSRQPRFNPPGSRPTPDDLWDFVFWAMLGVVVGGRLGIVLFYHLGDYIEDPLRVFRIWEGGMSFHGGLLGVVVALILFAQKKRIPFYRLSDPVACAAPIGLFLGRIANFVNGELWGRPTDVPWAMVFPSEMANRAGPTPRHPSQLYEAFAEGIVLFAILAVLAQRPSIRNRPGLLTGLFLVGYAIARSTCELFREPDYDVGFIIGPVSMGQILCIPMLLTGIGFVWWALKQPKVAAALA